MRTLSVVLLVLFAAGCSKPPGADTFTASPLPSAFVVLRSPNGQRHALLTLCGDRWQGQVDDTFAASSRAVFAGASGRELPEFVDFADPSAPPEDIAAWKPVTGLPVVVVEAFAGGDPSIPGAGPSSMVSLLRVAGDPPELALVNAALAADLAASVGVILPAGDSQPESEAVASGVAVEAAVQAVIDETAGTVNPRARMALLQIPVFLNSRFLAVEHYKYEDHGGEDGGTATSRFTLHDLTTGASPDPDALLDMSAISALARIAPTPGRIDPVSDEAPVDWHPSRPGVVLLYRAGSIAPVGHGSVRTVVPWRDVLPLLPEGSPLRAVAESVH